jgi:hypothetical protein
VPSALSSLPIASSGACEPPRMLLVAMIFIQSN